MPNSCKFDRIKQQLGQPEYLLSILSSAESTILPNSVCSPRTLLLQSRLIYGWSCIKCMPAQKSLSVNPNKKLQTIIIFGLKIPHVKVQILTGHAPGQLKNTKLAIDIGLDTDERS